MNWRDIPHPYYGNYGGGNNHGNNHKLLPIDELDALFKLHDIEVRTTNPLEKLKADHNLFNGLLNINIFSLKVPVYSQLYWGLSLLIFSIPTCVYWLKR